MKARSTFFLLIAVLTAAAGCATVTRGAVGGDGMASPAGTTIDCRNQGVYNRAANLCVSNGA